VLGRMGGDTPGGRHAYRELMKQGLEGEIENPLNLGKGKGIVGERGFVSKIKSEVLESKTSAREQPALRALQKANPCEELISRFASLIGKEKEEICRRGKNSVERAMLMELLYRLCKVTQPEIGRIVGIDYSAVSQARRRLKARLGQDQKLKRRFEELQTRLQ